MLRLYRKRAPPLGDLERDVLEFIWTNGFASAQHIHDGLLAQRNITLSTVQSTVERLVRKQLLSREKQGRAYLYGTTISRHSLLARMVAELVSELSDSRSLAGSALVDLTQAVDEDTLIQLERWVALSRSARDRAGG